jgi:tyrosine decarboxylase/aspartate 1-decarboxylase
MKFWKKYTTQERKQRISEALRQNVNFSNDVSFGYPASKLDEKVFYDDAPFLAEAPVLSTYVANPNHIGCHTMGSSEKAFKGTQEIEREVLTMLAVDLFKAEEDQFDGYIAPGGTEANIQALWVYRNLFMYQYKARFDEIAILATEDTHYSIAKGANLLGIKWMNVPVHPEHRNIETPTLENTITEALTSGIRYFIVVANMGTTMFGSVDSAELYVQTLHKFNCTFRLHIDGAYGGFVFPFLKPDHTLHFQNPHVSSITIDAHKMLQAPYGTGIFVCRKGLIENVLTKEAAYVEGMDVTLCGSRSGANAVAVWMILTTYGPNGWFEKVKILQMRTDWLCKELDARGIRYFREPAMNIVTLRSETISEVLAEKYNLVPQRHDEHNKWYKIVLMEHVEVDQMQQFLFDFDALHELSPSLG